MARARKTEQPEDEAPPLDFGGDDDLPVYENDEVNETIHDLVFEDGD
jgi:hypothetical protein